MGLIEAYREYRGGFWLAVAVVVVGLVAVGFAAGPATTPTPGHQMQVIQLVLAVGAGAVFAYAIRPGKARAGWLLWWIPPVLAVSSIPLQVLLPGLIANDTTTLMQLVFFLTLSWIAVLAAPVTWIAVCLPVEFIVRAVRGLSGDERNLTAPRLVWGLALGALTLGGVLVTVLMALPNSVLPVPRMLSVLASRYPNNGTLIELVLLFGPVLLGVPALVLLIVILLREGGFSRLVDALVLSVPPLEHVRRARRHDAGSPEAAQDVDPTEAASPWTGWNPVWLWRDVPGAVLVAVSTVVATFAVAILGNSPVYIHHLLLPVYVYVGPFTWSVVLSLLSGVVLALVLNGRHYRSLWLLGWIALAVTVVVGSWMMSADPTVGGLELFMVGFVAVICTALSCITWLFLVVPVQLTVTSVIALMSGHRRALTGLLLGLCLGSGGVGVVSGFLAVDRPGGANEAERQQAILAALLNTPGDYSVVSEPALWVARLSIAAMIIFGLSARGTAGGKGKLQDQLSDSALGPRTPDSDM